MKRSIALSIEVFAPFQGSQLDDLGESVDRLLAAAGQGLHQARAYCVVR